MRLTDVPEVAAIEQRVFADPWSVDSFVAEVERTPDIGFPLVLRDGGVLVGYAIVWFIVDEIHIGNLAVQPTRQRQGLASVMLDHVLSEGRRRSMVFATLEVRPSNRAALALYHRYGFRQIAVRRAYYRNNREDALVLACPLCEEAEKRFG
jgi:ribosomal-protein-alanine N-acetyltransferase